MQRTWCAWEIYRVLQQLQPGDRLLLYCKRGHSRSAWVCTIMLSVMLDIPLLEAILSLRCSCNVGGALAARPTVWTYRLSVTFRSTSLSDRPRVRIDRQAVKLDIKAYRLTLAFRSTSSGRPFAVAVGYLGLSVRRLRALAFRPTSAVRCSPLPSGTLVCLVVWSSSSCIVASPPQVRSKSARFWGSYVLIARRIDCRLHRLASKGGLCSCS